MRHGSATIRLDSGRPAAASDAVRRSPTREVCGAVSARHVPRRARDGDDMRQLSAAGVSPAGASCEGQVCAADAVPQPTVSHLASGLDSERPLADARSAAPTQTTALTVRSAPPGPRAGEINRDPSPIQARPVG